MNLEQIIKHFESLGYCVVNTINYNDVCLTIIKKNEYINILSNKNKTIVLDNTGNEIKDF